MFGRKKSPAQQAAAAEKKTLKKADQASKKATKKAAKADDKAAKKAAKAAPKSAFDRVTDPRSARKVMSAAKVIGPVVAPFALKAATSTREYLDTRKAGKLGVGTAEVGAYRGPTGPVEARLHGLKISVDELRSRRSSDLQVTRFADVATGRIADLSTAARAAASMPAGRRRSTLHAINRQLDQIDADLMTFLVGR